MEPIALYAVAGSIVAAIALQVFVAQVWSRRMIHQVRGTPLTENGSGIPYFGHLFQLLIYGYDYLQHARDGTSGAGRYSIRLLGRTYNIIYEPQLIMAVKEVKSSSISSRGTVLQIFENVLNLPPEPAAQESALKLASTPIDPGVQEETTKALIRTIQLQIPDFLSYMTGLIDQFPWERDTIMSISDDHDTATVAFYELLRNFTTHHILAALLPSSLVETHSHAQTFITDLWKIQAATFLLTLGLPRWVPIPRLTATHIARRNVLRTLSDLIAAIDKLGEGSVPSGEWENLDVEDVSPFLRDFQDSLKGAPGGATLPLEARASLLLARLLALCVPVTELASWTITHLFADTALLAQLRDEIKNEAATVTQPPSGFGIAEPVRLTLRLDALDKCATLQVAYLESVRLYDRSVDVACVTEDYDLRVDASLDKQRRGTARVRLGKGSYAVAAPWLYNTDPSEFLHAHKWWPDGPLRVDSLVDGEDIVPQGLVAALAGGGEMTRKVATALVAGFAAVWDVRLKDGVPKAKRSVSVAGPRGEVRAEVRRREVSVAGKSGSITG